MKTLIISDTHAFHKNIVKGCSTWSDVSKCRDFLTVDEHNSVLADNINKVTDKNDILIHLGDWSFGGVDKIKLFRDMINCSNIELVYGNHDTHIQNDVNLQKMFTRCDMLRTTKIEGQMIVLCHYALMVWEKCNKGWWMLHGHSHNSISHENDGKILDVCPEGHNFTPWTIDEIKVHMNSKPIVSKDHH